MLHATLNCGKKNVIECNSCKGFETSQFDEISPKLPVCKEVRQVESNERHGV